MNNWSITEKMYLYLSWDGEKVSIANPESKKYFGPVQKKSDSIKPPLIMDNTGSEVKLSGGKIYLKVSGKYVKITNLLEEEIINQLSEATLTAGEATGVIFGFSPYNPDKTILIFPGTSLYKTAEDEFMRKTSLSIYKKTTKYIPGHRYEIEGGSFWYIGKFNSARGDIKDYWADNYLGNKRIPSHVFSNFLPASKKLSDILSGCDILRGSNIENYSSLVYPECVVYTAKSKSMVDMGEELEIDITLEEATQKRVSEFMKTGKEEYSFGSSKYHYNGISKMLSIFDLSEIGTDTQTISPEIKGMIKEIITSEIHHTLFLNYDNTIEGGQTNIIVSTLEERFSKSYSAYYYNNLDYTKSLLKFLGVDNLEEMVDKLVPKYKTDPEFNTFQDYLDNIGYYRLRTPEIFESIIDFVYEKPELRKLSNFLPDCPYRDTLAKIFTEAIDTNGTNLDYFKIENVGTATKPLLKFTFYVTLQDLMRYHKVKNPQDLPENIQHDLLTLRIYRIKFITRADLNINLYE